MATFPVLFMQTFAGRGYAAGSDTYLTAIDGLEFNTETYIDPAAALSVGRGESAGVNSYTRGYVMGGAGSGGTFPTTIDGIIFATEAANTASATLATGRRYIRAGVNDAISGYALGGWTSALSYLLEIDGMTFATESSKNPSAVLSVARRAGAGYNSSTCGYCSGGYTGTYSNDIDGIIFATELANNPSAVLETPRQSGTGCNSGSTGYVLCGYASPGVNVGNVSGFAFISETSSTLFSSLLARNGPAGFNSHSRGYAFSGYVSPSPVSEIDGVDFITNTKIDPAATVYAARGASAGFQWGAL